MFTSLKSALLLSAILLFAFTNSISAHCDSVEGPVVKAAQEALRTGNINHVLIWIPEESENELKAFFQKVGSVRTLNEEARELADLYFYETVVRIHRMGEGVGYTGLRGEEFEPEAGIEAADMAIHDNSIEKILEHVDKDYHHKVTHYFEELQARKNYDTDDIAAGREYVESYVHFIHYVEGLFSGKSDNHTGEHHAH